MICKPCRRGGGLNQEGRTDEAKESHAECRGCDCQHKTGPHHLRPPESARPSAPARAPAAEPPQPKALTFWGPVRVIQA